MAALSYGRIDEFQPENESIAAYLERVELFFFSERYCGRETSSSFSERNRGKDLFTTAEPSRP